MWNAPSEITKDQHKLINVNNEAKPLKGWSTRLKWLFLNNN